ncbi:hypothetical protein R3P38DRAFT_3218504 [Favolaschia claudopus]|uniref:AAA-ATPase-like domain-containing protein n=1 Tax=Favolaschia claudopus TaxID=2862362 RepID=A0AAW0A3G7_9AGAR
MPFNAAEEILIQCILFDKIHCQQFRQFHVSIAGSLDPPVSGLLEAIHSEHLAAHTEGRCGLCSGETLIKCAWTVQLPIREAYDQTRLLTELTPGPPLQLMFMQPWLPLRQYVKYCAAEDNLTIICETVQAVAKPDMSPSKRPRSVSPTAAEGYGSGSSPKKARLDLDDPGHTFKGLHIISSIDESAPLNLPKPHFSFYDIATTTGIVFVDKSRFITTMNEALNQYYFCLVALPPNTGKTTFLSMLMAWLDRCGLPEVEWMTLFTSLEVGRTLPENSTEKELDVWLRASGGRSCLCLHLDLQKVKRAAKDSDGLLALSVHVYLQQTMQHFVAAHRAELGEFIFTTKELSDVGKMIATIFTQAAQRECQIFVLLDNWDAPLLSGLPVLGVNTVSTSSSTIKILTDFIGALVLPPHSNYKKYRKIVISGNIPVFEEIMAPLEKKGVTYLDISAQLCTTGGTAFGITEAECQDLATVLSLNRNVQPLLWRADQRKLGGFRPHPRKAKGKWGSVIYDFSLALQYLANVYSLNSGHETLANSSPLQSISDHCQNMLKQSSLRQERNVHVSPHTGMSTTDLLSCHKQESSLWILLHYLGVIKRDFAPGATYNDMWRMTLGSTYA